MFHRASCLPSPLPYVETVPQWLGPSLLLIGTASLMLWAGKRTLARVSPLRSDDTQVFLLLLLVLGVIFTSIGALARTGYMGQFSILLVAAGRFVEGGAAVRGMRKIHHVISTRSLPGDDEKLSSKVRAAIRKRELPEGSKKLRIKARYYAIRIGIGVGAIGLYLTALWVNGLTTSALFAITFTWTLAVFALAVIGLSWKLEAAEDRLAPSLIVGLLAASSGAQIFNYVNLVWDITAIVVGTVAFIAGIVTGVAAVLSS